MTTTDDPFWWRADALCSQVGPELFFLPLGDNAWDAKKVCAMCPVRVECLAESLIYEDEYGIFGGFGRDARRRMTRRITPRKNAYAVAREAIQKERRRDRTTTRPADQRDPARRRDRARLHPRAG